METIRVMFSTPALLEPSMADTYIRYPYLRLHGYRAMVT